MSTLILLSLALVGVLSNQGGLRLYFTDNFVNEAQHDWLPGLFASLKGKVIPLDIVIGKEKMPELTSYLGSYFNLTTLTIDYIDLGQNDFLFSVVPKNSTEENDRLRVTFTGLSYHFTIAYDMDGKVTDKGDLQLGGKISLFNVTGYFEQKSGVIQLHPLDLKVGTEGFTYHFDSLYWLFISLNSVASYVAPVLDKVVDYCLPVLAPVFEVELNKLFMGLSQNISHIQIPDTNMEVNLEMYEFKVDTHFVEATLNLSFADIRDPSHKIPFEPTPLPDSYLTTDGLRLQLTTYSINTFLYDVYQTGMLHVLIDGANLPSSVTQFFQLTTDWLDNIIPGMLDTFGGGKNCSVALNVTQEFYVRSDDHLGFLNTSVHVASEFSVDGTPPQHAVTLEFDLDLSLNAKFVVSSSSIAVKVQIGALELKNLAQENVHQGLNIDIPTLSQQLNALLGLGKSVISGLSIPLNLPTWLTFKSIDLKVGNNFVEFALNPTKPA